MRPLCLSSGSAFCRPRWASDARKAELVELEGLMIVDDFVIPLDKIHTTELGAQRVMKNLGLDTADVTAWCKKKIKYASKIIRKGKNWYVYADNLVITVNAHSHTVITAHKEKSR